MSISDGGGQLTCPCADVTNPVFQLNCGRTENVDQIFKLYADYSDVEEIAKVVTLREIEDKDYILSVNRYIERKAVETKPYETVKAEFQQAYQTMIAAEQKFRELLIQGGYEL